MQKITPFLWFEKDMKGIVDFYTTTFPGTRTKNNAEIENTPSGQAQMCTLEIFGLNINLMTAGPYLPFNPTISFIISCDTEEEVTKLWDTLSCTGKVLMDIGSYPFAEKYGWVQDKYGVSWQLMYSSTMKAPQKITPTLMFAGDICGRAEEAVNFYTSVFHNSTIDYISKYGEDGDDEQIETNGVIKHAGITIEHFHMALMDSGKKSPLTFQQAVSFVVNCADQTEVDYYWEKLTAGGTEIQCGWLNDKFGIPWQVVPTAMEKMLSEGTAEQKARVTEAFMKMKKFDIKLLEQAFDGK
jgi:predicted 3-demethylubiquinone-9 3-methyltransferase (glyoxalase superfamily)